jgi:hypothetical protein
VQAVAEPETNTSNAAPAFEAAPSGDPATQAVLVPAASFAAPAPAAKEAAAGVEEAACDEAVQAMLQMAPGEAGSVLVHRCLQLQASLVHLALL